MRLKNWGKLVGLVVGLITLSIGLAGCGGEGATPAGSGPTSLSQVGGGTAAAPQGSPGAGIAKPFFTPSSAAQPTTAPAYQLAFDASKPNEPAIEASVTYINTSGQNANEWRVEILGNGAVLYVKSPRDPAHASSQQRFLNPDKLQNLLQGLDKLGVLSWPDTNPPKSQPGLVRNLALYLVGRPKEISDMTGNTGDNLEKMLTLIQQTVEDAPLRDSP